MAKEAKQSHQANKILKNAAKGTKYTASQIFSDKTPYISSTMANTMNAARDVKEWARINNPFKANNGKDPLIRQMMNSARKLTKNVKRDIMRGDIAFTGVNKVVRDFIGEENMMGIGDFGSQFDSIDFDILDGYELADDDSSSPSIASTIIDVGSDLSSDFARVQAKSTSITVGAIDAASSRAVRSTAMITDAAVDRIISTNMMTTSRISTQIGEVRGNLDSINQNLLSIVEHNNEVNKFFSQSQTYMENTEQSLNDIKTLLEEVVAPMKSATSTPSWMREKPDFLNAGFDVKKYINFIMNDSSMGIPMQTVIATTLKTLKMTMPSFIDENFAMPISEILPVKPLIEKLVPAISRISDLDKAIANGFETFLSKMDKGEYRGLLNFAGMIGMGVSRFNKTIYDSSDYNKSTNVWNGKSERALQEVIPDYLSKIEGYLQLIADNTGKVVHGGEYNVYTPGFQGNFQRGLRTYDYVGGEFITNERVFDKVKKSLSSAVQTALYDAYGEIEKLMDGSPEGNAEMTSWIKKTFKDQDAELNDIDRAEFVNIISKYKKDDNIRHTSAIKAVNAFADARANAVRNIGDVYKKISHRDMSGYQLGDSVGDIPIDLLFESRENLEKRRYDAMTEKEKKEYDRKLAQENEAKSLKEKVTQHFFGTKDRFTGVYSGGKFSDLGNQYEDFKKNGTLISKALDYLLDMSQQAISGFVYGDDPKSWFKRKFSKGTNSLPTPGLFIGNTGERIESIPVKRRVDNFVNMAEAFGAEARDIKLQLSNMGKDRGVGNFRFADGADEINSKDLSLTENADGTFNLIGKRGGSIGTLGENGITYTSYGKKARSRFDKKHGAGSFDDLLGRQIRAKKEDRTGNKFIDNYINQMESSKKPQTVGEELVQNMNDIAHNTNVIAGQSLQAANTAANEAQKEAQSELSKRVFGEKDKNGFYQGKFFSDFANIGVDFKNMINHAINGKGYTTSAGVKISDSNDSISSTFNNLGDKAMQAVFGEDYKNKRGFAETSGFLKHFKAGLTGAYKGNDPLDEDLIHEIDIEALKRRDQVQAKHDEGKTSSDIAEELGIDEQEVKDILEGTISSIFGGSNQNEINDSLESAQEETNKKAQELHGKFLHGVKGGLIGLGAGLVGAGVHGLIPSLLLPGGPIGGAILGVAGAMLSKNDKFMNWMFGDKDDDGKRIGGIISRDLQEKFKSFGSKALGPGVLGAIGGLIFPKVTNLVLGPIGGALLGGGPIGGALLGVGASMLFRSEAMQKLWYGEDGNGGIKSALGKAKDNAGKFLKKNAKGLALTGLGAGAGALLGSGLFGATLVPGLFGATIGLAASSKSFSEFLFGTKREKRDEDGNVIGFERDGDGFLGKVGRMISLNLLTPFKRFAKTSSKSIAEWFRHDILWQMKSMIAPFTEPLHEAGKELAEAFSDLSGAAAKLVKKVFNPLFKVGRGVLKFAGKFTTGMLKGGARLAGNVVAAPFKILGGMGRAIAGKQDSIRDHMARFRYGNSVDSDFQYEGIKHGFGRIFNPLGRLTAWGMNKGKHALTGAGQILTGAGDSAFSKISPWHAIPEAIQAGKRTKGGAFEKLNAFGQALNPYNIFDKNRRIYAENNDLTGNAAFMNPIEKRRHKRKAHEIEFDDKEMRKIEKRTQKWAKKDGYNDKVELTSSEFRKRKNYFKRKGYDVSEIKNSADLMNLMYDPFGNKTKNKLKQQSKEEEAQNATVESKDILKDISNSIDNLLNWFTKGKIGKEGRDDDEAAIRAMSEAGLSEEEIAESLGISGKKVSGFMDKIHQKKRKENVEAAEVFLNNKDTEDMSLKDIARNLGLSPQEYKDLKIDFAKRQGNRPKDDIDVSGKEARNLDQWMDNNAIGRTTSNILSAPVMAMSKLRDKLSGIDDVTRKNIIMDLNSGMSESDVAAKYGLKVKQIKRIISEEEVRNTRAVDGAKLFSGKKKSKTNANKKDGDGEEETPFVNATLVGEDGKPLMGKKSFLGKLFGAKGVLTTIGVAAAGAGIVYLLTKFPQIIDFAKETIWPMLRDVVWPTLKTLLTGIGAAILGVGKFIKSGSNAVQGFMNFCTTGTWETFEEAEKKSQQATNYGLSSNAVQLEYLKTRGGFADAVGKKANDSISTTDVYTAAYVYMANKLLLEGDTSDGIVTYQALADYIKEHKFGTQQAIDKIARAHGGIVGNLIPGIGSAWIPTKSQKDEALQRAISYVNGDYGNYRMHIDYPTVLDNAQLSSDSSSDNVGDGIGYGHFMQNDPRWANRKYSRTNVGGYTTMANGGCGPTALANVATQSGIRTNPSAIASMAQRFGYTSDGGSTAGLFTSGASRLGLKSKPIGAGAIRKALSAGNKVIFAGKGRGNGLYTNAGHILSARGVDKRGNAIVDDPLRRGTISVPISRIGNGITHAWSIGRGEDETDEVNTNTNDVINSNGTDTFEYNGKTYDKEYIKSNMFAMMVADTVDDSIRIDNHPSHYYYQKNPKWADVYSPRFGGTIGDAGCVESTFGSLLANITGMNYRPDLFVTKFNTTNNLKDMLQSALPPSMSGITVKRYNLRPWADKDYLSNGNFSSNEALDITTRAIRTYQPGYAQDIDPIRGPLLNYIRYKPFIIHGGTYYRAPDIENPKSDDVFKKDYSNTEPIYSKHALLVVPSTSNHDGLEMSKTKYFILNSGTQQASYQGKSYTFKTLFDHNQGIDSIFTLEGLTGNITDMPGFSNTNSARNVRDPSDLDWFLNGQDKASIIETASTATIKPDGTSSSESEGGEEKDDSFIGALGRALSDFTKIIWNNVKALFSKDHQYHSIYDENKVTYNAIKGSGSSNTYDYQSALANAIGSSLASDGIIEYMGKQVPIDSLTPQQIAGAYYAREMRNKALAQAGGIQDNGDGTITVSAEVVEKAYASSGKETYGAIGSSLIAGLKNRFESSAKYSDAVNVTDYTILPQWAKDFVHVSKNDFISDILPTSSKLSQSDILNMVNIATRIISHHEAKGDYTGAYNDMGQLSVGINGFHAGNAAEIFARMKKADTEGDVLSDEDRAIASNYEAFSTKYLTDPLWSKYPGISDWLGQHHSANKKIQDAMIQQLQFSAIAKVLPLFDEGILNDPRSVLMISQFAGFGPAHTSRIVDSLRANPGQIAGNSYGELAAVTKTMDKFYSGRVNTYNKYISGFRNRFRDIYDELGGEGGSDAIGFGGNIRDSYTTTYPTIVDTPVAINSSGPVEVEAPVMSSQLELIIHYLKEIAMAAKRRPVSTATTAQTNLDIGHGGLAMDQKLKNAGLQRQEVLPVYTEKPDHPDKLKSIHNRIARSPRPV